MDAGHTNLTESNVHLPAVVCTDILTFRRASCMLLFLTYKLFIYNLGEHILYVFVNGNNSECRRLISVEVYLTVEEQDSIIHLGILKNIV